MFILLLLFFFFFKIKREPRLSTPQNSRRAASNSNTGTPTTDPDGDFPKRNYLIKLANAFNMQQILGLKFLHQF